MSVVRPLRLIAALAIALGMAGAAHASITSYTSAAGFQAAASSYGVDSFDDLVQGASGSFLLSRMLGPHGYTAAASTTAGFKNVGVGTDTWLSTSDPISSIYFLPNSSNENGIGGYFFTTDLNGNPLSGDIAITVTNRSGETQTTTLSNTGTSSYLGFISSSGISSLNVSAVQPASSYELWTTANNLTVAIVAVPEPASYALLLSGLALISAVARRRMNQSA
jgi:hypothetical protein